VGELSVCNREAEPATGWSKTSQTDKDGRYYYAPVQNKTIRPKLKREFTYTDREGNPLVKVTRLDDGNGKRQFFQSHWDGKMWVNKLPDETKPQIPIYRYAEVRKAIAAGEPIFVVEGEGVADALWSVGIAATTFIGGAGKYSSYGRSYKQDLEGATIVLCPDRDQPGLRHMEEVAQDFSHAQWLYAPPNQFFWQHLPESRGLDVGDWINDGATVADIMSQVGEKKLFGDRNQSLNNVIPHPALQQQSDDLLAVKEEIQSLLSNSPSESDIELALIEIRQRYPSLQPAEVTRAKEAIAEGLERSSAKEDDKKEVTDLLRLSEQSLDLTSYLPVELANPLEMYCRWLSIRPEVVLLALLTATSSLHEVGTELVIHRSQGFSVVPTIYSAIVSESGQKKSPITRQIITNPLGLLKKEALDLHKAALLEYEAELVEWKWKQSEAKQAKEPFDEQEPEEPPPQTVFWFTDGNGEGIKAQAHRSPKKALFALVDELSGLFHSANKYTHGRGSDRQDMLSYFDGSGQTVLRSSGVKVDVANIYLSVFGTIQPEVIRQIMRDSADPDGQWARFLYVQQPLAAAELQDDDGSGVNVVDLLAGIYRRLFDTPSKQYTLSRDAFKIYQFYYNQLEQLRVTHPNPGMRASYSKAEGYTGRLALNLHVLHELGTGKTTPSSEIPVERMKQAIALMNFFIGQTKVLYSAFDEGITPHLTKLIEQSRTRYNNTGEGWIKAKDVQLSYNSKSRPKPDTVRSWMVQAKQLHLGEIRGSGIKIEFHFSPQKVDLVDSGGQKVDSPSTNENPSIQGLFKKVDLVDSPTHLFEKETACPPQPHSDLLSIKSESTSPPKSETPVLEGITAVDSPSTLCPPESTESTFSPNEVGVSAIHISDSLIDEFLAIETRHQAIALPGIPCGFYALDAMTGGFQRSDLIILAGRPAMGKTSLALNLAYNISTLYEIPSIIFSSAMSRKQITERFLSSEAGIESGYLRSGRIAQTQWAPLSRSVGMLSGLPIFIHESQNLTSESVAQEIERVKCDVNSDTAIVIIDCLPINKDEKSIDAMLVALKQIAKKMDVPIIINMPVSRSVESRGNKRPRLSDLQLGNNAEEIADLILFLYRDDYYKSNSSDRGTAEVIVAKQRNGPTGTIRLAFDPQFTNFKNLARHNVSYQETIDIESAPLNTSDTSDTVAICPELPPTPTVSDRSQSGEGERVVLKPLSFSLAVGDRIECYPTLNHATNKWKVSAVIRDVSEEQGYFTGCTIDYRDKKRGAMSAHIPGGSYDWIFRKG